MAWSGVGLLRGESGCRVGRLRGAVVCGMGCLVIVGSGFGQRLEPRTGAPVDRGGVRVVRGLGPVSGVAANQYLVVYRDGLIPGDAAVRAEGVGGSLIRRHDRLGVAVVRLADGRAVKALAAMPGVAAVVHDRVVTAGRVEFAPTGSNEAPDGAGGWAELLGRSRLEPPVWNPVGQPIWGPVLPVVTNPGFHVQPGPVAPPPPPPTPPAPTPAPYDTYYAGSPQGWAVRGVGGYGLGVAGGPTTGPWDTTRGKGMRIAVLDSGVDAAHPDIAPNLALNLTEVDQTGLPSACDDGSPQDQQGHGTWVASLAAGAMGEGTGLTVGVAPEASILNIKVLERLPNGDGSDPAAQCPTGQASGLLSWVLAGIDDAVANHADVISISLGTLVDLSTGDGAGLKAAFDQVTYAAAEQGAVLIAAAGNDGLDLSNPRYMEVPAQSRDVLAIVASTNPDCAENLAAGAGCAAGPVTLAYYSDLGAPLNALAAPGGSLPEGADTAVSGWVRGACSAGKPGTVDGAPVDQNHSYGCFNLGHAQYVQAMGTSASAPLAAGVAALLRAKNPTWSAAQIVAAMRSSATTVPGMAFPELNGAAALAVTQ